MFDAWSRASRGEIPWSAFYLWAYLQGADRPVSLSEVTETLPYTARTLRTAASQLEEVGLAERRRSGRQVHLFALRPQHEAYPTANRRQAPPVRPEPPFQRPYDQPPPRPERVRVEAPDAWGEWLRATGRRDAASARVKPHAAEALRLLWSSGQTPEDLNKHTRERILDARNPLGVLACMVQSDGTIEAEALRRRDTPQFTHTSTEWSAPTAAERHAAAASFLDD